jgi:hypothetical protein
VRREDHDGARETDKQAVCSPLPHHSDAPQRGQGGKRARCLGCGVTMEEPDPKILALLRI